MANNFDKQRHRKALTYTALICGALLLMFIFISWKVMPPTVPVVQDLIEINLGNNDEGFGEEQPLIKGPGKPEKEIAEQSKPAPAKEEVTEEKITPDENAEERIIFIAPSEERFFSRSKLAMAATGMVARTGQP